MKIFIFLLALLYFPSGVWGGNFKNYLSYIDRAESCIVYDNFKEAQVFYDSAFHSWNKPFAIDLLNDLKCANLNTDYPTVRLLASHLVSLGCELSFFQEPIYLSAFRGSPEWKSLIDEYPAIRMKYVKNNDWKLRSQIEKMCAKDQFLRQLDHNYTFLRDSIYKTDDTIKTELQHIFKHKFPNEYDFGVFLSDDTTLMDYHPLHIIILHNYGKDDTAVVHNANLKTFDFTNILLAAVEKGDMHPEDFALLNDRSGKFMIGYGFGQMALLYKIDKKLYCEKESTKMNDEITANRKRIGLCTREDGRKKLIYDKIRNSNKFILRKSLFGISDFGIPWSENQLKKLFIDTGVTLE